jgi:predicted ATPase
MLTLKLFGGCSLHFDEQPVEIQGGDKVRALLTYLALENQRMHERQALAALLWPEIPDEDARSRLRVALSRLKSSLAPFEEAVGAALLDVEHGGVRLSTGSVLRVDARRFDDLLAECQGHPHRGAAACFACRSRLQEAVELYHGGFLESFSLADAVAFDEWSALYREHFEQGFLGALEVLADYHLRRGDTSRAQDYARRQLALEPWREAAHRQLMHALATTGKRAAALAQYRTCQQVMKQEFDASPSPATTALYERIQRAELGTGRMGRGHNLPAPATPLVGRQGEMRQVLERLSDPVTRLITLSGPGGVGKTRLALEIAWEALGGFGHGVWWVSLVGGAAPQGNAEDNLSSLVAALASALEADFSTKADLAGQVRRYLREREILLVLDSFEHLVEPCAPWVAQLLREAPRLAVLVTSRKRLNLRSEWALSLPGLPAVPADVVWSEGEELPPAVQLFYERAARVGCQLPVNQNNFAQVAKICTLLEGLPLGVELAAAWTPVMGLGNIARAIENDLDFLAGEHPELAKRHRSLRAVFNSSWERLAPEERRALAGMSVFQGSFDRLAAERVVGIGLGEISALEQRSLLQTGADGRLRLHARLRGYAAEQVASLPDLQGLAARHARHYLGHLIASREALFGMSPRPALDVIRAEWDELRAAWSWATRALSLELLTPAIKPLARFARLSGWMVEAARLFEDARLGLLAQTCKTESSVVRLQCELLFAQTELIRVQGNYARSLELCQEAQELAAGIDDAATARWALCQIAELYIDLGNLTAAAGHLERLRASPDLLPGLHARLHYVLGILAVKRGDLDRAEASFEEALIFYQRVGDALMELSITNWLAEVNYFRGQYVEALRLTQTHLELARAQGDRFTEADTLSKRGLIYLELGDLRQARPFIEAALALSVEIGDPQQQAHNLALLGRYWQAQADLGNAHHYLEQASTAFSKMGLCYDEMEAGLALGELYLQAGYRKEASKQLQAALEYFEKNGGRDQVARALAGLALLDHAESRFTEALQRIEVLLPELDRAAAPLSVYLACYHILVALEDARAGDVLEIARRMLHSRADQIHDAVLRRAFLQNVPAHRQIMGGLPERPVYK